MGLNNFSVRSFKGDFTDTPTVITYTPSKIVHLDQIDLFKKKAPTITLRLVIAQPKSFHLESTYYFLYNINKDKKEVLGIATQSPMQRRISK